MKGYSFFILFFLLGGYTSSIGQNREGNWWYFGTHAGMDFTHGDPVADHNGQQQGNLTTGTISDRHGKLLFYTDGHRVFNGLHQLTPGGGGLITNDPFFAASQVLISRIPGQDSLYYIFIYARRSSPSSAYLLSYQYDLRLDGGNGDVVLASLDTVIDFNLGVAVPLSGLALMQHANGHDFWLVTHVAPGNAFWTFLIDSSGISPTPVVTNTGYSYPLNVTMLYNSVNFKSSPNSGHLCVTPGFVSAAIPRSFELYRFDRLHGTLYDRVELNLNIPGESFVFTHSAFSPDNNLLYVSNVYDLLQVDISSMDSQHIAASRALIVQGPRPVGIAFYGFQLGQNGKIYTQRTWQHIAVINCPNASGTGCNYMDSVLDLAPATAGQRFPTQNQTLFVNANILQAQADEDTICLGDSVNLSAYGAGADSFVWVKISGPGPPGLSGTSGGLIKAGPQAGTHTYRVIGFKTCGSPDTALVTLTVLAAPVANAGPDLGLCRPDTVQIGSATSTGVFRWRQLNGQPLGNLLNDSTVQRPWVRGFNAPAGVNTLTFILTASNPGCAKTDTVTITLNDLPVATGLAGPDQTKCSSGPLLLGVFAVQNLSYQWGLVPSGATTNLQNPTTAQPLFTFVPPATAVSPLIFTWRVQVSDSAGCRNSDTVQVFVRAVSKRLAGPDLSFCTGDSVQVGTAPLPGVVYSWIWEAVNHTNTNASLSDTTLARPYFWAQHSDTVPRQYRLTVRGEDIPIGIGSQCVNTDTATVTVNPLPVADSTGTFTACSGDSVVISEPVRPGYTYLWVLPNNQPPTTNNPFVTVFFNNDSLPRTDTLYLAITDTLSGCTRTVPRYVTIHPLPEAAAGEDTVLCSGDTVQVGSLPLPIHLNSYLWTVHPQGATNYFLTSAIIPSPGFSGTNTTLTDSVFLAIVEVTSVAGCKNADTVRITISGKPTAGITGPLSVCPGLAGVQYWTTGSNPFPTTGSGWTATGGTIANTGANNDTATVDWGSVPTDSAKVTTVPTNQRGCKGDTATLTVRINKLLNTQTPQGDTSICSYDFIQTYGLLPSPGSQYIWTVTGGTLINGQGTGGVTVSFPHDSLGPQTANLWVTETVTTSTDTCFGASDTVAVMIYPSPDSTLNINGATDLCAGDSLTVQIDTTFTGSTYNWTVSPGATATLLSGQGAFTAVIATVPTVGVTGSNLQLTVTETNQYNCPGRPIDTSVTVNPLPPVNTGPAQAFCSGDSVQVGATAIPNLSYLWSALNNQPPTISYQLSDSLTSNPYITANGIYLATLALNLKLQTTNTPAGCANTDSLTLTLHPEPDSALSITGIRDLYPGDTLTVSHPSALTGSAFNWIVSPTTAGSILSGQGTLAAVIASAVATGAAGSNLLVSVTETTINGCTSASLDTSLFIQPFPAPTRIPTADTMICPNSSGEKQYIVSGTQGSGFHWITNSAGAVILGQGTDTALIDWITSPSDPYPTLQVVETSNIGCPGDTITIPIYIDRSKPELIRVSTLEPAESLIEINWNIQETQYWTDTLRLWRMGLFPAANQEQVAQSVLISGGYTDNTADPEKRVYGYHATTTNRCGVVMETDIHNNILLGATARENYGEEGRSVVQWGEYTGWAETPRYELYRALENEETFRLYKTGELSPVILNNASEGFRHRYRVKAVTSDPREYSWSNSATVTFENKIYIPNLFTPNGDGYNETFEILNIGLYPDNELQIYNRYGREVYRRAGYRNDWNADNVTSGTYLYWFTDKATGRNFRGMVQVVK